MISLDKHVQNVWAATSIEMKRAAFITLINESHGKKETKTLALNKVKTLSAKQLDSYASNYAFSGEGMKV